MTTKILIVEDNMDTRELVDFYFIHAGFAVSPATDGEEGIYRVNTKQPDIILTDLTMPNLSGIDMINGLKLPLLSSRALLLRRVIKVDRHFYICSRLSQWKYQSH